MKALSIREPWASLIVLGIKRVENRSWGTKYRGPLLIHAANKFDRDGWDWVLQNAKRLGYPQILHFPPPFMKGGIIGVAELFAVSESSEMGLRSWPSEVSDASLQWFFGPRGLWLRDARPLPWMPWKGQLGLFDVPVTDDYLRGQVDWGFRCATT